MDSDFGLIDINHMLFATDDDYVEFVETDAICAGAAAALAEHGTRHETGKPSLLALCPPTYYSLTNGVADNRRINDALLGIAARTGNRAIGVAEPKYGDAAREEIVRIAGLGAAGVTWSPRAQGVFGDDRHMAELCRFVADQGMVSLVRSAPYSINESLARLWHLATQCGRAPLVVLGAFASWENVQAMQHNAGGPANVYYDISGLSAARDLEGTVAAIGSQRLLFGSGGARFLDTARDILDRCTFAEPAKHAIRSGNAAALLRRER